MVMGKTINLVRDFSETAIVLGTGDAETDEDFDEVWSGTSTGTFSSAGVGVRLDVLRRVHRYVPSL
ncbi:hypothetical protein ABZ128_13510 [Streptomyces sp. NPDC006326]|uniref:hypothetical protein n=1 Tax=Streptomyces sp. NPDC006326 TaxID=3156752 RepID=UPI0033B5500A